MILYIRAALRRLFNQRFILIQENAKTKKTPLIFRCFDAFGEAALRWPSAEQFDNDLQFHSVHRYKVYNITSCVHIRHLLGRTRVLECGVLDNLEERLRFIIESGIKDGCIDLEAATIYDDDGNRVFTRYNIAAM